MHTDFLVQRVYKNSKMHGFLCPYIITHNTLFSKYTNFSYPGIIIIVRGPTVYQFYHIVGKYMKKSDSNHNVHGSMRRRCRRTVWW